MKQYKPLNVTLTVVFIIALVVLLITASIGLPIYFRFFYYIQIKTLHMEEATGWDYNTIKAAYDDVLNYLTLPNRPFGTGELAWTEAEAAHFADCKVLFNLNLGGIIGSFVVTVTLAVLNKCKVITLCRPLGRRAYFWAAVAALALPVLIFLCVLIVGFDNAFAAFHAIFFPGKENWLFNSQTEQIINVMPEEFFMNCAIIIACGLVASSVSLIIADVLLKRKEKLKNAECNN